VTHWRRMFPDEKYLGAWDIEEKPDGVVVVIARVEVEELNNGTTKEHKPVAYFRGKKKGMVLNKTNCKVIAQLYGNNTADWIGKSVEICAVEVTAFGKTQPALRVKSRVPSSRAAASDPVDDGRDDAGFEAA